MNFEDDLRGKRVLVTGACGVVGRWIAEAFANAGAHVCLTDARQQDLEALASKPPFTDSFLWPADLRDAAAIDTLVTEAGKRWGGIDVLVNNAGLYPSSFLLDLEADDWDRVMDVNVRAPFLLSRAVARQMIAGGIKGTIINVSSGASRKMRSTAVPYCVSKTALDRLTKGFALELAEHGIRVNALEPGFAQGSVVSPLTGAHIEATRAAIPLGRPTSATDVANTVLFLASSAAAYVTGATLTVDGGNSIGSQAVYQDKKHAL
ncbi:MAG TPA: SDR family oxidoreductase [Pseudomonas sp.]|uniref:SDR family NAD(P)-dependent oxidoreductase n=1 Tax=Pseudomonas sp. TaxID=306 RepID=UPI002B4685AC|nr:SDR family oxidoreductase [Pseudomonas sp.]HKS13618.1 SDR family oxidoreductase [Pseudomonas sp.]